MPISSLRGKMLHHGRWLRNHTFPTPEQRTFCLHRGEDNLVPPGHSPRVTTASTAKLAATQPHGGGGAGGGAGNLPAAATRPAGQPPEHLSRLKGEEQNLTFSSLGLISSAKPPF